MQAITIYWKSLYSSSCLHFFALIIYRFVTILKEGKKSWKYRMHIFMCDIDLYHAVLLSSHNVVSTSVLFRAKWLDFTELLLKHVLWVKMKYFFRWYWEWPHTFITQKKKLSLQEPIFPGLLLSYVDTWADSMVGVGGGGYLRAIKLSLLWDGFPNILALPCFPKDKVWVGSNNP